MVLINIEDAAGKNHQFEFSNSDASDNITDEFTVKQLKNRIDSELSIPARFQCIRDNENNFLMDHTVLDDSAKYSQLHLELHLKAGCTCGPLSIKCKDFECKFRLCCFYNGIDCVFDKCQYCCVHCKCTIM